MGWEHTVHSWRASNFLRLQAGYVGVFTGKKCTEL